MTNDPMNRGAIRLLIYRNAWLATERAEPVNVSRGQEVDANFMVVRVQARRRVTLMHSSMDYVPGQRLRSERGSER